jgi:benzoyl-CoA reductase subunit C
MNRGNANREKKRVGYFCSYVPEELIIAAGLEPVRLKGEVEEVKEADAYLFSSICPSLKYILDSGLRKKFDVEGIVFAHSCDGMRRLYDLWNQYGKTPFTYMLEIPKNRDENGIRYFSEQLRDLKAGLEDFFAITISNDKLEEAIALNNTHRQMVMELFEKQREAPPPLRGSDLLALCLEEATSPKEETTVKLKELIEKSESSNISQDKNPRILITGNMGATLTLAQLTESAGASVVALDTCYGMKHYSGIVESDRDPLEGLARRYLLKPACPRMPGFNTRIERLEELTQDYSIDGIIYSIIKFCDYGLFEAPEIRRSLGNRLPLLILENDYIWSDEGRVKTRVEAFVEMIGNESS